MLVVFDIKFFLFEESFRIIGNWNGIIFLTAEFLIQFGCFSLKFCVTEGVTLWSITPYVMNTEKKNKATNSWLYPRWRWIGGIFTTASWPYHIGQWRLQIFCNFKIKSLNFSINWLRIPWKATSFYESWGLLEHRYMWKQFGCYFKACT